MVSIDQWEMQYRNKGYFLKYPDEDLIRFMAKYFYHSPNRNEKTILDLGSGVGRNTIYLAKEGFRAFGIDAADSAVEVGKTILEHEDIHATFKKCDLSDIQFQDEYFDAVVDIQSIQHNTYKEIKKIVQETHRVLKPNGLFFAKMVSIQDYSFKKGTKIEEHTLEAISEGTFVDAGITHFFDIDEIRTLMSIFGHIDIEYTVRTFDNMKFKSAYWLVTAKKVN